jgi:hypothetical protein
MFPLFKQLDIMQYHERIKWIKQNKIDVLLTLYSVYTSSDNKVLDLWKNQIDEILFLQNLLVVSKVNYALVKTIFLIPYLHTDIDIIVDEADINKAVSELRRNGYHANRVLNAGYTLELRKGNVSIELHSKIVTLGMLRLSFKQINELVELSIDLYNKLLNKVRYWRCPSLPINYVLKLLDILDHKIITVADLLELKIFSDMLGVNNVLSMKNELYKYPKAITLSEIALIEKTLSSFKKVVEVKPDILSFIKDTAYYFKIRAGIV